MEFSGKFKGVDPLSQLEMKIRQCQYKQKLTYSSKLKKKKLTKIRMSVYCSPPIKNCIAELKVGVMYFTNIHL